MKQFLIEYNVPNSDPPETETISVEFEDWTGRATDENGEPFGPVTTITAEEWADDYGYTLADKGYYKVEEIK